MKQYPPAEGRRTLPLASAAAALPLLCLSPVAAAPPAGRAAVAPKAPALVVSVNAAAAPPRPVAPPAFTGAGAAVTVTAAPPEPDGASAGLLEPEPAPTPSPDPARELLAVMRAAWPSYEPGAPTVELPAALRGAAVAQEEIAPGVTAAALRLPGVVLVAVRREAAPSVAAEDAAELGPVRPVPSPLPVRFDVRLPRGLWRGDAALLPTGTQKEAIPNRWRLQGALCTGGASPVAKTLAVAPGQTLVLRFTETVAAARRAHAGCRGFTQEGGATYSGASIRTAHREIGAILDSLPAFVARGDRATVTKKVHRALLSAAQAQAMLENARGSGLFEAERGMQTLVGALSEVSCTASGLVPSQAVVRVGEGGAPTAVRVTLTNAGPKTIPVIALGFSAADAAAEPGSPFPDAQNVFRDVPPGRSVSATFPVRGGAGGRGLVRFIIGMGAAAVPATPAP